MQDVFSSTVRPGAASTDHHHQLRFTITHFEGEVSYEATGFTSTNRDRLAPHLRGLLAACVVWCVCVCVRVCVCACAGCRGDGRVVVACLFSRHVAVSFGHV